MVSQSKCETCGRALEPGGRYCGPACERVATAGSGVGRAQTTARAREALDAVKRRRRET